MKRWQLIYSTAAVHFPFIFTLPQTNKMDVSVFKSTINQSSPPDVSVYAKSLWYDAKGDWHKAHELIQDLTDATAAWIHAYLHRKEGDLGNADYWYRRAGKIRPPFSLAEEWEQLAAALL